VPSSVSPHQATLMTATLWPCSAGGNGSVGGAVMRTQNTKAREYGDRAIDQFEQLRADAEGSARVMALVVHPYIMGAPHRLRYFREALEHIRAREDVAFFTGEQILDWYSAAGPAA